MRVSVLDSLILDSEILRILEETLLPVVDSCQLTKWTEEIRLFIKFLLWKYSVYENGSSVGQTLLGLTYRNSSSERKSQLLILFIFDTIVPYIYSKLRRKLVNVEPLYWKWMDIASQLAKFLNLCIFLRNGHYPSLAHRFAQLIMIRRDTHGIPSVNYSTQTRQLVWHYFADFLAIVLPIVKIHRIRSYVSRLMIGQRKSASMSRATALKATSSDKSSTNMVAKCCYCKEDATIPIPINNSPCTFCYYCFKSKQMLLESQDVEEVRKSLCTFH